MSRAGPDRRALLAGLGAAALTTAFPAGAGARTRARVVIVGGGFGGATAARFVKTFLPEASVTLIEANPVYTACPFSNLVIGGEREITGQQFSYEALAAAGVSVVHDRAIAVNAARRTVTGQSDAVWSYDKLILSPGIDLRWDAIEGYGEDAAAIFPHAWKAGEQTLLLRRQLKAMPDGGLVVMSVPPAPFRCPPGPYERASLIAQYLKNQKPKSKLLILDAQDQFSKQPLFEEAWAELYPGVVERRGAQDFGRVVSVDPAARTLATEFESVTADVANVIPPQKAGAIAGIAEVSDATGWCPVDPVTFASTLQPDIHIIGDAIIAAPMPKSAFAANLQAKLCAFQVSRLLAGLAPRPATLTNTCYSFTSSDTAISITGVYRSGEGAFVSVDGSGGTTPLGAERYVRENEAMQAQTWFRTITRQAFG
ncbi:putative sulfide dehydrogenase, flavoprotein subunit [Hyphomonas neptunium ATCC 15444]|uniref:Putative sulfide dehydrogenase, flavoprotein subunit n=2 Tax=Hyphomonas TaxID=85 RepID=Q0BZB8_HYPNA|nr:MULTISPECIES: NAD(P)/FAD-dependent oxidoreductase [Hyphomonas]ABI77661.1 putative sulfide dehydrogenase, flavoprotein subunit [Hyphomonas neptunium ATCC 15444]KCZ95264.1 putative sulfide dehydrogenase, flavoprotein subunit [Hyphomonas hirschiana VP5]